MTLPPPYSSVNWNPGPDEIRREARHWLRGFPIGATVVFLVIWWLRDSPHWTGPLFLLGFGLSVGTLGQLAPPSVRWFYRVWYFLLCTFEFVIATGTLVLFYYLVLTPFGLASQLLRRKAFPKGPDPKQKTYWTHPGPPLTPKDYFRQY